MNSLVMSRKDKSIYLRNLAKSGESIDFPTKARRDPASHPIQTRTDSADPSSLTSKRVLGSAFIQSHVFADLALFLTYIVSTCHSNRALAAKNLAVAEW